MTLDQILQGIADLWTQLDARLADIDGRLAALETAQQNEPPATPPVPRDPDEQYEGAHHHHDHVHDGVGVIHHHDPTSGDARPGKKAKSV